MKQYIWILLALISLTFASCKESEEPFVSNNEQDRDDDKITGDDYIYHLPVIFHVLYQDKDAKDKDGNKTQYIPQSQLKKLLDNVNDLYRGQLYTFGETKDTPSENIHVQFELALYDEDGNKLATPGVEYIQYTGEYPIDCNSFMTQKKGKNKIIWDPNEYINIMVYNFKQSNDNSTTLGISNLPFQVNDLPNIEGLEDGKGNTNLNKNNIGYEYCVSLNSLYIYNESSRYSDKEHGQNGYTYSSADANVTLAHELGHYLGLRHVFAESQKDDSTEPADNCDDTDYCTDTKSYNKLAYDKWCKHYLDSVDKVKGEYKMSELIKRSNDKGEKWDSDNFMDYAISLSFRFTPLQRDRMRQVLYYSPLIPGPKKNRAANTTRSNGNDEIIDLPIRLAKERFIPVNPIKGKIQAKNSITRRKIQTK